MFVFHTRIRTVSDNGVVRSAKCPMAFMNTATLRGCRYSSQCTSRKRQLHTTSLLVSKPQHVLTSVRACCCRIDCPHHQSIESMRLLSTCARADLRHSLSTCVTCFRLVLTCVSAFSALTQTDGKLQFRFCRSTSPCSLPCFPACSLLAPSSPLCKLSS